MSSCQAENERLARTLFSVRSADNVGFGNTDILVRAAVVKKEPIGRVHHSFDEDDIGDLADLLPLFFGGEDGGVRAREKLAGIAAVEDGNAGAIDEMIVGAVVNEDDAAPGEDRRRAGLDDAGIKFSRAARENRSLRGFRPVEKIARIREAHLIGLVRGGPEPVHPILAFDFFGDDSAGLGPTLVPVAFVGGKDHALAFPMDQVTGSGEAKLRVLFVVAGVREVEGVAELLQARIFDPAVFFVVGLGREDRVAMAGEVDAVGALSVAETRGAGGVLRAVEHDEFAKGKCDSGVERAGGFPSGALGRKDGFVGRARPRAEGQIDGLRG